MKRILFSSCLLAACLTACNNEDVLNEAPVQNVTEEASVVGANLVSHGMKIRINGDEASTRVTDNGGWEANDQVGLAWYNFKKDGAITDVQQKSAWETAFRDGFNTDAQLYANHIFTVENVNGVDQFTTMTDVYQGAYFIYFPYERLGGVKKKVVEFNAAPQTGDFDSERYNKAFRISTQDFISADEAVGENNELEKAFALKMAVSPVKVDVTPSEEIKGNAYFQGVKVTKLQIKAGGNAATVQPFITKAELKPSGLPKVELKDGEIDYSASYQAIFEAANGKKFIDKLTTAASLTTNVENDAYTLADARAVRAFVYPLNSLVTYSSASQYPTASVTVSKTQNGKTWVVGTFAINNTNSEGFAKKLRKYLADDASDAGVDKAAIRLNKILSNGDNVGYLDLAGDAAANLELANFTPTLNITSIDQWNDMVALYNALDELGAIKKLAAAYQEPTFVWAGTEVFNGEIQTPANVNVKLRTTKPMIIEGDVIWPKNLITNSHDKTLENIVVNGTLHVGEDAEVVIDANLTNNGTIYAGKLASIGVQHGSGDGSEACTGQNTVSNTNGRIYVAYGAYVYPKSGEEGEIAYIVNDASEETVNKIHVLIEGGSAEQANVNMLVVENTTLDLNAKGRATSSSDDRYEGTTPGSQVVMPELGNVAIELVNGHIVKVLSGDNSSVKSVTTKEDEGKATVNSITDVQINDGNIKIEENTELSINSETTPLKTTIDLGDGSIENYGTLNANTNVATTNINNEVGTINVAASYSITYSGTYTQGGTVHGSVNKE